MRIWPARVKMAGESNLGLILGLLVGAQLAGAAFALAVVLFGSSRPAVLSLIALFVVGGYLLTRVDVAAGRRRAQEEDAQILGAAQAS